MREFVEYADRRYWLQSSGRYYQSGVKTDVERLLHRRIWSDANGPIPPDFHVHHVTHSRQHMLERSATPDGRAASLAALEKGRDAARAWHASPEGLAWHRAHGSASMAARKPKARICEACGAGYESKGGDGSRYCSSACNQQVLFRTYFTEERACRPKYWTFAPASRRKTKCWMRPRSSSGASLMMARQPRRNCVFTNTNTALPILIRGRARPTPNERA